jgi:hypothetical protein
VSDDSEYEYSCVLECEAEQPSVKLLAFLGIVPPPFVDAFEDGNLDRN